MDRAVTEAKPFIACLLAAVAVLGLATVGCSDMRSGQTSRKVAVAPTEAATRCAGWRSGRGRTAATAGAETGVGAIRTRSARNGDAVSRATMTADAQRMTEELFREDAYARSCEAEVTAALEGGVYLDRTVFYCQAAASRAIAAGCCSPTAPRSRSSTRLRSRDKSPIGSQTAAARPRSAPAWSPRSTGRAATA